MSESPISSEIKPDVAQPKTWSVGTLTYTKAGLAFLFFWLLWGDFVWALKDRSVSPVVQLLLKKYEASDFLIGLLLGTLPCLFTMTLGPMVSFRSDRYRGRWGRRIPFILLPTPFIVLSMVGLAYCPQLGAALHLALGGISPGLNPSILVVFGVCWTAFEFGTVTSSFVFGGLLGDVVPRELAGRFYGMFRALSLLAGIVFNYQLMGKVESHFAWIFIGIGAVYGIGVTAMCFKVKEGEYPPVEPHEMTHSFWGSVKLFMTECFGHSFYWWYFVVIGLLFAAGTPMNLFGVNFAKSVGMSMDTYGKCIALTFGISLLLSYPMGVLADRFHPLRVGLIVQAVNAAVAFLGALLIRDAFTYGVFLVITGVVGGCWLTSIASVGIRMLPRSKLAQFGSASAMVGNLIQLTTGPVTGAILDRVNHDYRYSYLVSGLLFTVGVLGGLVLYRKFVKLGGPDGFVPPET